jgi:oligopeptide/dipeptide ABC transporter ATP-binding protein
MENLLLVRDIKKYFPLKKRTPLEKPLPFRAVDGVSFTVKQHQTLGIVGESGCGKTTTGRCVLRLSEPTAGAVYYRGQDILALSRREMDKLRKSLQIVFQDSLSSLNPRYTIRQILAEPFRTHRFRCENQSVLREAIGELAATVGLADDALQKYPHEFSGGQRQRIGIARALALEPDFIVCDEPVSALDVSIQSQILNLFLDLQERFGLTYLFISHDLSVVRFISHHICVMYMGKIVETAPTGELFRHQTHPYTKLLISSIPGQSRPEDRVPLDDPAPSERQGCRFGPRCPEARPICWDKEPDLQEIAPDHYTACHLYNI